MMNSMQGKMTEIMYEQKDQKMCTQGLQEQITELMDQNKEIMKENASWAYFELHLQLKNRQQTLFTMSRRQFIPVQSRKQDTKMIRRQKKSIWIVER